MIKLWFRGKQTIDKNSTWQDLSVEHYEDWNPAEGLSPGSPHGKFPLAEFGGFVQLVDWINEENRYQFIGYPRTFNPGDILVAGWKSQNNNTVQIGVFLFAKSATQTLPAGAWFGPSVSQVVGGKLQFCKIPATEEISASLKNDYYTCSS